MPDETQQNSQPIKRRPRRPTVAVPASLHPQQRVGIDIVSALTGDSKSKIYEAVAAGTFPTPERDGVRCTRWRVQDIFDYLDRRRGDALTAQPQQAPVPRDPRRAAAAIVQQRGQEWAKRLVAALAEQAEGAPT